MGLGLSVGCQQWQPAEPVAKNTLELPAIEFDVPPGAEVQNCLYMKVPNDGDIDVGKVMMNFAEGTHHAHVYYGEESHADGIEECFSAVDFDKWHLLVATQRKNLEWELPPGVSFKLHAHQQLLIQVHFVNVGILLTDDNKGRGKISFQTREPGETQMYMGSIFGQQRQIDIKPHSTYSIDGMCRLPRDVNMAALAGHYHFKGQRFVASKLEHGAGSGDEFYRTEDFAEPIFDTYKKGDLTFTNGQKILWHCDYDNPSEQEIFFGPRELTEEHCNMFAFYYPANGEQEFTPCVSYGRCQKKCADDETCSLAGECVKKTTTCTPACTGKQCGDDGCGGQCGTCGANQQCTANQCVPVVCAPKCAGKQCGDDGCGGQCGTCGAGLSCDAAGQCGVVGCSGDESEPNDKSYQPNAACGNSPWRGKISSASDVDWFSFDLAAGETYKLTLGGLPADYTYNVYFLSAAGNVSFLGRPTDDHTLADQSWVSTSANGGKYLVKVYSYAGASDVNQSYNLSLKRL